MSSSDKLESYRKLTSHLARTLTLKDLKNKVSPIPFKLSRVDICFSPCSQSSWDFFGQKLTLLSKVLSGRYVIENRF